MIKEQVHSFGAEALECTRFHCFDADCLSKTIGGISVQQRRLFPGSFDGCVTTLHARDLLLTIVECNLPFVCSGQSIPGSWNLAAVLDGHGDYVANGAILLPLQMKVLSPDAEIHFRTPPNATFTGFFVDGVALRHRLEQLGAPDLDERKLDTVYQRSASSLAWMQRIRNVRELAMSGRSLSAGQAKTILHDLLNDAIASSLCGAEKTIEGMSPSRQRRYRLLRQLEEYVNHHSARPIHLHEMTAELKVSERTLEYLCRDLMGTSAYGYMLNLRLNGAYRQLSSQPGSSVKEVALDWGFSHFPRFARLYERLFGELPHETRARNRPVT